MLEYITNFFNEPQKVEWYDPRQYVQALEQYWVDEKSISDIVWAHKEWMGVIFGASTALYALYRFKHRQLAQKPLVEWKTSLNCAKLKIKVPPAEKISPNVTLTFCIDQSGSMQEKREEEVKRGVEAVLEDAKKVVRADPGAKISVAACGFNTQANLIAEPTEITQSSAQGLIDRVKAYKSNGGTTIVNGLEFAAGQVERLAKENPLAKHVLIVLSDGKDKGKKDFKQIQQRLTAKKTQVFAIGIGEGHTKETMRDIAQNEKNYIDTTKKGQSIEGAIQTIYATSLATFSDLRLECPLLPKETWSIGNTKNGKNGIVLGSLSEKVAMEKLVTIDPKTLKEPLDLRKVVFKLVGVDPKGRKFAQWLDWNPHSIIDPEVFREIPG